MKKTSPSRRAGASSSAAAAAVAGDSKTLVIAEKPSVMRDIARALGGGFENKKEYFESGSYVVTSAVGHMLELAAPEGAEVKRGKWSLKNLPVIPDHFDLQPIASNASKLKILAKLYRRKDIARVINACDAGREGELIFHFLMRHFRAAKPVQRLWLQSMTPQAIRDGFGNLRGGDELRPLQDAAVCRAESDWLIGINATRAMTALNSGGGGFSLTTVGRVQTPTLAILVDREKEIQDFTPRDYWEIVATFDIDSGQYQGRWTDPQRAAAAAKAAKQTKDDGANSTKDAHGTARPERIWDKSRAEAIVAKCRGREAAVTETTKPASQSPPQLFDLTSLQREANRRFGFSARATLAIAQALYERHKVLTYPRTDSRALPEDYPPTVKKILQSLSKLPGRGRDGGGSDDDGDGERTAGIGHWAGKALADNYVKAGDKRLFNNARVSDHFAIIPTGELPRNLKEQELRIYDLVTRCFIAAFYPPARFMNTTRHSVVDAETFVTRGRVLLEGGWMRVMGRKETSETLPPLAVEAGESDTATVADIEMEDKQTRPPPRYSEATLLSAMEGAGKSLDDDELREAMRGRGLGTPATRASIIEELIKVRYILRDARELVPTPKAKTLLRLLRALEIHELTRAELTGEWEKKLKMIESDAFSSDEFMRHIRAMTGDIVAAAQNCDVDRIDGQYVTLDARCPKCGDGEVRENYRKFVCQSCDFFIWKSIAARELSPAEATALLRERRVGPLDGFRSRLGSEFSAELVIKNDFTASFDFDDDDGDDAIDPQNCEQVGACPKCGTAVVDTGKRYSCGNALGDKAACDFTFGRQILSRAIEPSEIRQLLADGKTPLLQGFISKRNKRPFAAHLTLDLANKTGKLGFEFAPRKGPVGSKKKVAAKA